MELLSHSPIKILDHNSLTALEARYLDVSDPNMLFSLVVTLVCSISMFKIAPDLNFGASNLTERKRNGTARQKQNHST